MPVEDAQPTVATVVVGGRTFHAFMECWKPGMTPLTTLERVRDRGVLTFTLSWRDDIATVDQVDADSGPWNVRINGSTATANSPLLPGDIVVWAGT